MIIKVRGSPYHYLWIIMILSSIMSSTALAELDWVRITTEYTPPRIDGHNMVYDILNEVCISYGWYSVDGGAPMYLYDGMNWYQTQPSGDWPSARSHFGMAYDASRNVVVVFGGFQGGSDYLGDTWEWDGVRWEQKFPVNPPADRAGHSLAYIDSIGFVCLFGGYVESVGRTNELTLWDGETWIDVTPPNGPSPRTSTQLAFDSVRNRLVLFGGTENGYSPLHDTWEWDGNQWEEIITAHSPTGKYMHCLVYYPDREISVLFGGNDDPYGLSRETWEYDGTDWTQIQTDHRPVARTSHAACYDSARGRIVMYGGYSDSGSLNDTWEYYDVPTPTPSPTPTQTPTLTPTPTATPPVTGVMIDMPSHLFHAGDSCFCTVTVTNANPNPLTDHPLFVILDAYGIYFFAPSFTQTPENYPGPWPSGTTDVEVIPAFSWPDTDTSASGLFFYAALTDPEVTHIVGEWDSWEFGWE